MHILYLTEYFPPHIGGQELLFEKIVNGISSKDIYCTVITSRTNKKSLLNENNLNQSIYRINIPKYFFRFFFTIKAVYKSFKLKNNFDLIHGSTYGGALPAFILSILLRKPAILTVHEFMCKKWFEFGHNFFTSSFYYLSELLISKMSFKKFIAVSNYTKTKLIEAGVNKNKIEVIYNGDNVILLTNKFEVDELRNKYGYSKDDFIFLAYGRAGITKGFEYLVEAIPKIFEKIKKAAFILILTKADNKIWKKIEKSIDKINSNRYTFCKQVEINKLIEYLAIADCVVIPSLSEGFGFTTREAVIFGKKIVATNVGSIPDVISGDYILIDSKSADAIVKGCLDIYNNNYASKLHKHFNWDDTINNYISIYRDL